MTRKVKKAKEITDARISFVSLVDKAANKRQFLIVKDEEGKAAFTTYGKIIKTDSESHFVTGVVYEPMVEDAHGNYMTADEIANAVADAVAAMNQSYVDDLKKAGTFKEEEQAQALSRAISVAIKSLSKDALDYIKEISGGDTVGYLTTRIQAQISRNKGVSK